MAVITRRGILAGLFASPAIIKTPGLLMPVKAQPLAITRVHDSVSVMGGTMAEREAFLKEFSEEVLRAYFKAYPGVQQWHRRFSKGENVAIGRAHRAGPPRGLQAPPDGGLHTG